MFDVQSMDWKNQICWVIKPQGHSIIDPVLMQYTGLKDKNGKEIYEGDVVNIPYDNDSKRGFIVEWNTDGWWPKEYSHYDWDLKDTVPWEDSEIIGNIYENPELLNEKI